MGGASRGVRFWVLTCRPATQRLIEGHCGGFHSVRSPTVSRTTFTSPLAKVDAGECRIFCLFFSPAAACFIKFLVLPSIMPFSWNPWEIPRTLYNYCTNCRLTTFICPPWEELVSFLKYLCCADALLLLHPHSLQPPLHHRLVTTNSHLYLRSRWHLQIWIHSLLKERAVEINSGGGGGVWGWVGGSAMLRGG